MLFCQIFKLKEKHVIGIINNYFHAEKKECQFSHKEAEIH